MPHDHAKHIKGHGCIEIRECWTLSDPEYLANLFHDGTTWKHLRKLVQGRTEQQMGSEERQISLLHLQLGTTRRWRCAPRLDIEIKNKLNRVLQTAIQEYENSLRKDHGSKNLAVLRHITQMGVCAKQLRTD